MQNKITQRVARCAALASLLGISATLPFAAAQNRFSGGFRNRRTAPPVITSGPSSSTVTAGQTASFAVTASGTAPFTYQWNKNGTAISGATSSTYTTPVTSTSDNGEDFTVVVRNSAGSATSGAAVLTVTAPPPVNSGKLSSNPTSVAFGNVTVSSSSSQNVTFTNTGNSSVTISNIVVGGAGFNATGQASGAVLSGGQTATLAVTFAPGAAGNASGTVTVTSNATNSPTVIALSGTGIAQTSHSVSLRWTASTSSVSGYNVYSSGVSGGPYAKLTSTPIAATNYLDSTVQSGKSYYYVVTSVNSQSQESGYSGQVSAVIP